MAVSMRLFVSEGWVPCPNRGMTQLDTCLFCEHLEEVELDGSSPAIVCAPPARSRQLGTTHHKNGNGNSSKKFASNSTSNSTASRVLKPKIDESTKDLLRLTSLRYPDWGVGRLTRAMRNEGRLISSRQVGHFLNSEGLALRENRLFRLEQKVVSGEIQPDAHQIEVLELADPCFKEWTTYGERPGQRLIQTTLPVYQGGRGTAIYAQIVMDSYSSYTFGMLHAGTHPLTGIMILQYFAFPFFRNHGYRVERISTPPLPVYANVGSQSYAAFLADLDLEYTLLTRESEYVKKFTNLFWKAWSSQLPKPSRVNLESLQFNLDEALENYNHHTALPGFPNLGSTAQSRIERV